MDTKQVTGFWRFYFKHIWLVGWQAMRALVIVECAVGLLLFFAWRISDLDRVETQLGSISDWWFFGPIIGVFVILCMQVNHAAFNRLERSVLERKNHAEHRGIATAILRVVAERLPIGRDIEGTMESWRAHEHSADVEHFQHETTIWIQETRHALSSIDDTVADEFWKREDGFTLSPKLGDILRMFQTYLLRLEDLRDHMRSVLGK